MSRRKPKQKPKTSRPSTVVGIGWYEPAEYAKLKQVAADPDVLCDTFEDWLRNAERLEREIARPDFILRRVLINVDALVAWCRDRKIPVDGAARSQYASELGRGGT